jgi:hypothetical protein
VDTVFGAASLLLSVYSITESPGKEKTDCKIFREDPVLCPVLFDPRTWIINFV